MLLLGDINAKKLNRVDKHIRMNLIEDHFTFNFSHITRKEVNIAYYHHHRRPVFVFSQ